MAPGVRLENGPSCFAKERELTPLGREDPTVRNDIIQPLQSATAIGEEGPEPIYIGPIAQQGLMRSLQFHIIMSRCFELDSSVALSE
ncbi:hypothetical protein MHYP_G00209540 [Metynnis hypsauchen]